jgi:hypothetical protein
VILRGAAALSQKNLIARGSRCDERKSAEMHLGVSAMLEMCCATVEFGHKNERLGDVRFQAEFIRTRVIFGSDGLYSRALSHLPQGKAKQTFIRRALYVECDR